MVSKLVATSLYALAFALGRLPWVCLHRVGDGIAVLWRQLDMRESRVARRNLELALPALTQAQQIALHHDVLRTTARQALETLRLWTRPHAENLHLIREVEGMELFDAAIASRRGVIIAAPHYGNWELLNQWLASRTPLAILYRAPESKIGEAFLQRMRKDPAHRVTQVRAEGPAVRQLFKRLRDGGVVGILPDQQPKAGDGEFAPFFGIQALTMTLLPRLAARSGAAVLFAYCERIDNLQDTRRAPAFRLRFDAAPADIAAPESIRGVQALDSAIERIARRDPAQYQWTYKRYTLQPPGSARDNPYRDLERH
jgi:KDO2-lipid IV(A) lauroyltransferase